MWRGPDLPGDDVGVFWVGQVFSPILWTGVYSPLLACQDETELNLNNFKSHAQWPPGSAHMLFLWDFDILINVTEFNGELKEFILYACIQ